MIPFPFFQVFAATDATTSGIGGSHAESELSDFPGEHPSDKDLTDWLDAVLPKLRRAYGAILRGETPQHLLQYEGGADDLTGLRRIDATAAPPAGMSAARVMQHNRHVDVEHAAVASRRRQLANGLRTEKNNLAQLVITMLRRRAPLRLKALLASHAVAGHAECHDGAAMMNAIIALRGRSRRLAQYGRCARVVSRIAARVASSTSRQELSVAARIFGRACSCRATRTCCRPLAMLAES